MKAILQTAGMYQVCRLALSLLIVLGVSLCAGATSSEEADLESLKTELVLLKNQFVEMQAAMQSQIEQLQAKVVTLEKSIPSGPSLAGSNSATANPASLVSNLTPAANSNETARTTHSASPPPVSARYPITLYGKVKFDGIYDTVSLGSDELIQFITPSMNGDTKSRISFTERETRLGLAVDGPDLQGWNTHARIETDFYGSAQSSGSGSLRIRRAYFETSNERTSFKFGQDWLPVASMNPDTLNFSIMGYSGNLWGRVPQVTISQKFSDAFSASLTAFRFRRADDVEPGLKTDLRWPWFGGKLAYEVSLFDTAKPATFGISGGYRSGCIEVTDVFPYLLAFEFDVPLTDKVNLLGEWYEGKGLGSEFYHQGGTFNKTGSAIGTRGGYVQVGINPDNPLKFHMGYGYDNPDDGDVGNGFYLKNSSLYTNVYYTFMENTTFGLEATEVKTVWPGGTEEGYRLQGSFIFVW